MTSACRYELAIVLGALLHPDGRPSAAMRRRVAHAVALHRAGQVQRLLLSGGGAPCEADAMAELARAAGVKPSVLLLERQSRNTVENALFSLRLVEPGARLVVVSDAWHLPRALHVFRRLGAAVTGSAPAPASTIGHCRGLVREAARFPVTFWRLARLRRTHP